MEKRLRDLAVAILAVGAAAVALYLGFGAHGQKVNLDTYQVLGTVTAEETASLLGGKGRILVMARDTGAAKNPSVEAELAAFQQTLKRKAGLSVVTERVRVTPMLMMSTGGGLPPDQFLKALETHPDLGAVVLFFGFPQLTEPELDTLRKTGVKTVVVSSLRPGYKRLLGQQAIQVAIVRQANPASPATPARTVRERFDQEYTVLTPADAARLP
jgi:hypothetical protein